MNILRIIYALVLVGLSAWYFIRRKKAPQHVQQFRKGSFSNKEVKRLAKTMTWGTYGKNGDQPLKFVYLKDCDTEHLQAILDTQHHIKGSDTEAVIRYLLEKRA